ncbi:MAG: 4a-hydroxytetrahydrobiopterin dehydratase [Spirulinaceae cyanobacterium RM2_2_10]|nr:4a-hydroxytetrahydrobiopterin dehydratase [Spirulinaceae cyanobacterium SM2_1_0]NJO20828.1 4a-hydroxytetrahydrobiopterin dehydratase [Spirulinaceae cyanobacterium RM2_2_10]
MAQLLNDTEIQARARALPTWQVQGQAVEKTFQFKDFVAAIDFVNKLVAPAEAAGHHPDLTISYNRVTVSLTSHDAGGLTAADFDLAATVSQLA